ncbi:MAG: hypothetical protein V4686_02110 [Patescibacteria group bacterium]
MHKKTFNIASLCVVALLVAFAITQKENKSKNFSDNIEAENSVVSAENNKTLAYQQEILRAVVDQNIKSFEEVSDSFKKKPTDTLSDTISKNIFSQYIEYNSSKSLDVETIQAETVEALKGHPVQKSAVGLQDIKIVGNSVANLRDYGNRVGHLQTEMLKAVFKIQNKSNQHLYIKAIYKTMSNLYLKESVPESLAQDHLGIINAYMDYATGFGLLEVQSSDPAKALSGVQLAKEAQDLLVASLSSVKKIVLLNNIKYTPGEPAYVWFQDGASGTQIKTN